MNEDIQKKLFAMQAKIDALEAKTKKIETDTMRYIDDHLEEHLHLHKMIYPSYFKTHPEAMDSLLQMDKVFQRKFGEPDKKND